MRKRDGFLAKHGIIPADGFAGYHYAYALYALYMIDAMRLAEEVEDGLCFDEDEIAVSLDNLKQAQQTMQDYRRKLNLPYPEFDIAETISLKGCRLEKGRLIGNDEEAVETAGMWYRDYLNEKGSFFSFEVAVYILFLLQKEVDYSFLIRRKE